MVERNGNFEKRCSNFELFRIVLMLLIVLHHYCVNSGFDKVITLENITLNTILIQFMAFGGKVGVNGFFLLSGYFMAKKSFHFEKIVKLLFAVFFYNVLVAGFLWSIGYHVGVKILIKQVASVLFELPEDFVGSYLLIYMLSPILNKGIKALTEIEVLFLLSILIGYFCILGTFLNRSTWNYFGWGLSMYIMGSYIRLYYHKIYNNKWLWTNLTIGCLLTIWLSIIAVDFIGSKYDFTCWTYLISNANKLPVFLMGLSLFFVFLNLNLKYNKYINVISASAFGVMLIHANSDTMRQWLWRDFLKNTAYFTSNFLFIHMFVSVITIYLVCTAIDMLRIRLIEGPLIGAVSKKICKLSQKNWLRPETRLG